MAYQKVLILGANGMLGHDLAEVFSDLKPILWDQGDLDITDEKQVGQKLAELKPELVINAAAYTDVDGAELNEELASRVNGYAVGYLAAACHKLGAVLVHFSTEYVFSGRQEAGYAEIDMPDPLNAYGRSKALGEKLLRQNCEMYYLIRASWLYGRSPQIGKPRGLNFVETMLKLARAGQEIKVVNDQFGKPTFARDLAFGTRQLIDKKKPCGIYHLVNENVCSWYDFAKKIFAIENIEVSLSPISSADYNQTTPRPKYSVLINTKTEPLRNWEEALDEYMSDKKTS